MAGHICSGQLQFAVLGIARSVLFVSLCNLFAICKYIVFNC